MYENEVLEQTRLKFYNFIISPIYITLIIGTFFTQSFANSITSLPKNWISTYTNKEHTFPIWEVSNTKSNFISKYIFTLIKTDAHGGVFNLCYTQNIRFLNSNISVLFKSNSGKEDQGGGIIWRVQDKNNYYITRYNPLEDNLCIYYVKNGRRRLLQEKIVFLEDKQWHSMQISQIFNHYKVMLDNKTILVGDDKTFNKSGGVGIWTKADALTTFMDFRVVGIN